AELEGRSGRIYLRGARCETVMFLCGYGRARGSTRSRENATEQCEIEELRRSMDNTNCIRFSILGSLIEDGNAKLRGANKPRREASGVSFMAAVKGSRELTGKIRRKNGVRPTTVESGPPISGVREMEMEERNRGDPRDHPCQHQEMPPDNRSN